MLVFFAAVTVVHVLSALLLIFPSVKWLSFCQVASTQCSAKYRRTNDPLLRPANNTAATHSSPGQQLLTRPLHTGLSELDESVQA
jgi:hypothetical protein